MRGTSTILIFIIVGCGSTDRQSSNFAQDTTNVSKQKTSNNYNSFETPLFDSIPDFKVNYRDESGLRQGYWITGNDKIAKKVSYQVNDTGMWVISPLECFSRNEPRPVKGYMLNGACSHSDSIFVLCPFNNENKIFYSGLFIKACPAGVHRVYYPNGKIKFESENGIYKKFNPEGQLMVTDSLKNFVHFTPAN